MIKAIIIDDEKFCIEVLEELVKENCPGVEIVATCKGGESGLQAIRKYKPDLIFVDIEMPKMSGFEMLEVINPIEFAVIFTTAYDNYAIRAFKYSAMDYLLKPIDGGDLKLAVAKYQFPRGQHNFSAQIELLKENIRQLNPANIQRIAIPTLEGIIMQPIHDIIYCEASSSYTILHLKEKEKIVSAKTLKDYEEMLEDHNFFRIHHSHLINLNYVEKYIKGDGAYVVMTDKTSISISRSKKEAFVARLLG
jgi:two-component system LytT family response regulator